MPEDAEIETPSDADRTSNDPRDMLADVFARQADLARYYQTMRPDGFYSWPPQERCTTWTRAIVHECCELDNELNWKPWKNGVDLTANREERLFEMADILHFYIQLALDQDFSAEEIFGRTSPRTTRIGAASDLIHATSQAPTRHARGHNPHRRQGCRMPS